MKTKHNLSNGDIGQKIFDIRDQLIKNAGYYVGIANGELAEYAKHVRPSVAELAIEKALDQFAEEMFFGFDHMNMKPSDGWISVGDRLPDEKGHVWIFRDGELYPIKAWWAGKQFLVSEGYTDADYWMILRIPLPPKLPKSAGIKPTNDK